jgi:lipase chaperone LimK
VADGIIRARSIEQDVKLIQEIQDDEKLTDEQKDVFIQAMFVRIPKILADEKLTNEQRQAAIKESFKSSHRE